MAHEKEVANGVEWRVTMTDGSSKNLVPEAGLITRAWLFMKGLLVGLVLKVFKFLKKAWRLGVDDPRKVIHCLKVGMALSVVSLFYYTRPLYDGVGKTAMWAVMTVVVVFEYTVGATIGKSLNRVIGTCLAGFLALGVHWFASQFGLKLEPVIAGISIFLLATAATFSRSIPSVKARFDYGAMIFILTFALISISGYRVDKLFDMAHHRISTIIIGTSLCILISMLVCPVWAGEELHTLITRNMDKLASSLDSCVAKYFEEGDGLVYETDQESKKKLMGYKCVLTSKTAEEAMANFARWEPPHGRFGFKHPWKQYLKVGALVRSCAYCIEALSSCIYSENQTPEPIKKHLSNVCLRVSSSCSSLVKELVITIKTTKKSATIDILVGDMKNAVQDLQNDLSNLQELLVSAPQKEAEKQENKEFGAESVAMGAIPLMDIVPLVTSASLLIEIALRVEDIVDAVDELAKLAEFKLVEDDKSKQNQPCTQLSTYQEP